MNINKQIFRQVDESRGPGDYRVNNTYSYNGNQYTGDVGYLNTFNGGIDKERIDADSYLKGIHIKNSKAFCKNRNPIINFKLTENEVSVQNINLTTQRKSCNSVFEADYTKRHLNPNLKPIQNHLNFSNARMGIDSRHAKR